MDGPTPDRLRHASRGGLGALYGLTLLVAACSILYELVLAQTLSALLGNTVLRYSITIGAYLGSLGLGAILSGRLKGPCHRHLFRVELALSVVGGLAVPAFFVLDALQRYFYLGDGALAGSPVAPVGFLVLTHMVIVAIGILSGFEVPLLLRWGEQLRAGSTNRVLGVDYLGSLIGAVLFPIILLPELGLWATAFAVASLNAMAALGLAAWQSRESPRTGATIVAGGTVGVLLCGLSASDDLEQHFLRSFYYMRDVEEPLGVFKPTGDLPRVEHHRSPYQAIDIVYDPDPRQPWSDLVMGDAPERADLYLYLESEFQLFSGLEAGYHEWFVHVPVQAAGRVPRRALVLGGGDGMLVRELLAYPDVEEVVHVELDPVMADLSRHHRDLSVLNAPAHRDPRHHLVQADAFAWLRGDHGLFDAAFVDMPYPRDHNLAAVYSVEFYTLLAERLGPEGYVVLDAPDGLCDVEDSLWPIYGSTLRAAGFETLVQVRSELDLGAPEIDRLLADTEVLTVRDNGATTRLEGDEATAWLVDALMKTLDTLPVHEFILAYPENVDLRRPVTPTWTDFGVEHRVLRPELLPMALYTGCATPEDPNAVNSVFRPTLPPLQLVSLREP